MDALAHRRPGPRLYHKKSRLGCLRCKARRVKCDELRPSCSGCSRHEVECVYPAGAPTSNPNTSSNGGHAAANSRGRSGASGSRARARGSSRNGAGGRSRGRGRIEAAAVVTIKRDASAEPSIDDHPSSSSTEDRFLVSGYHVETSSEGDIDQDRATRARTRAAAAAAAPDDDASDAPLDLPESRARRLTELRLLHHYLLQQTQTFGQPQSRGLTRAGTQGREQPFLWSVDLIGRALEREEHHPRGARDEHDSILYALLAHSALSLWLGGGVDARAEARASRAVREARRAANRLLHQQYLALALRAQRRAVAALLATSSSPSSASSSSSSPAIASAISASASASASASSSSTAPPVSDAALRLADTVGTASLLLVNHSFALVQTLPLDPWQPPHEWLQMGRGAMQVMEVATAYLARHDGNRDLLSRAGPWPPSPDEASSPPTSLVAKLLLSPPHFDPAEMFAPVWAAPYLWLLERPRELPQEDDDEDGKDEADGGSGSFAPYYAALAYTGWCAAAAGRPSEPINTICRRLAGAAYWFPSALEARLRERRPRAMVCLAQYFALWIPFEPGRSTSSSAGARGVWMMGSAGRRQVAAIHAALPARWKAKVAPLLA